MIFVKFFIFQTFILLRSELNGENHELEAVVAVCGNNYAGRGSGVQANAELIGRCCLESIHKVTVIEAYFKLLAAALAYANILGLADGSIAQAVNDAVAEGHANGISRLIVNNERNAVNGALKLAAVYIDGVLEILGNSLSVIKEVALKTAGNNNIAAHGEGNVAAADGNGNHLFLIAGADALNIAESGAGNDEFVVAVAFDFLAAESKTEAVNGNESENSVFNLKHGARVNRAAVIIAYGKDALINHLFENCLGNGIALESVHGGKLGIFLGIHTHK